MYKLLFISFLILLTACNPATHQNKIYSSLDYIRAHLSFLSSDDMQGREATKHGARLASDYIAAQLQLFGVLPYGDKGSYFQNFPMTISTWSQDSYLMLKEDAWSERFVMGEHFLPYTSGTSSAGESQTVFVGYGITDSLYAYDDYAGLDVSGKIVVMLSGEPECKNDPEYFKGVKPTKWFRSKSKRLLAIKKGVTGIVVLPDLKGAPKYSQYKRWFLSEKFSLKKTSMDDAQNIPPAIYVDSVLAKKLLKASNESYADILKNIAFGKIEAGKTLPITLQMDIHKKSRDAKARNVVGIIQGTDPQKQDEYISVGAHYDHLGMRDTVVYNGADDNGSGSTAILESARQVAADAANQRSIIYVFYTGEEKGLLGSTYFTDHFSKMDKVMANINVDMVGRGAADSIYVIGSGRISSEYFNLVEQANQQSVKFGFNYLLDDENHPSDIYHRSDHWNFAKHNIPIVFLFDYDMHDYHSPRDDFNRINLAKVTQIARLTTTITLDVANLDHWLERDKSARD